MPSANARRSKRHEREIVHVAEEAGITAERAWNSDGRSLGEHEECDVRLEAPGGSTWTAQAKRRKTVADYLTCDGTDVVGPNARSHTAVLSGTVVGDRKLLMKVQLGMSANNNVAMKLAARSPDPDIASAVHEVLAE